MPALEEALIKPVMTRHAQKYPITTKCLNYRMVYTCFQVALLTYTGACLYQHPHLLVQLAAVLDSGGEEGIIPI